MRARVVLLGVTLLAVLGPAAANGGQGFTAHVTNPWFPLTPGAVYTYVGVRTASLRAR